MTVGIVRGLVGALALVVVLLGSGAGAQELPPGKPKISEAIYAHQSEKAAARKLSGDAGSGMLKSFGLTGTSFDSETCALYVERVLTPVEKGELAAAGVTVHDVYVPPVPGKHPHGFYLATVPYMSLPAVAADTRVVYLESLEFQAEPHNDAAGVFTSVDDVHAGNGVVARTGAGVKIAIADSGIDLTHADFPTPVEQFDVTDGIGLANWSTDVTNTVSDHGTHVTGSALGSGLLSGGKIGRASCRESV